MNNYEKLIEIVKDINSSKTKTNIDTGKGFNIFKVLGLTTKEVRTHSAFIAELLDSKGSHGQGNIFLELFLNEFYDGRSDFCKDEYTVKKEFQIGLIDAKYSTGGSIDILLRDKNGNLIKIENKINAKDEYRQLYRYYNFNKDKTLKLFYLTLNGTSPSIESSFELIENRDFDCISYFEREGLKSITNWLKACKEQIKGKDLLTIIIDQYLETLNHLNLNYNMEELIKILEENIDKLNAAKDISKAYEIIKEKTYQEIKKSLDINRQVQIPKSKISFKNYSFSYTIFEGSNDGLGFKLYVKDGDENISQSDTHKKEISKLIEVCKKINPNFDDNTDGLVWINFSKVPNKSKLKEQDFFNSIVAEKKQIEFSNSLKTEIDDFIKKFSEALKKEQN